MKMMSSLSGQIERRNKMKQVYCSNCGTRLNIMRKALPKYATIIDVVEFHKCPPKPVEFDLTPVDIPVFQETKEKNKFVSKLNDLSPVADFHREVAKAVLGGISTANLRDRRFEVDSEKPKSSAPPSVLELVKGMDNSSPERALVEPESED